MDIVLNRLLKLGIKRAKGSKYDGLLPFVGYGVCIHVVTLLSYSHSIVAGGLEEMS